MVMNVELKMLECRWQIDQSLTVMKIINLNRSGLEKLQMSGYDQRETNALLTIKLDINGSKLAGPR